MKKKSNNVLLDCDKMKHPHTGLYFFCQHLALALQNESEKRGDKFAVFLPSRISGVLGNQIAYQTRKWIDRFWFRLNPSVKVWHSSFQLGKYFPKSEQKVVLTIHDLNFLYEKDGKRKQEGLKKLQRNIDRSDYLVAISEYTKQDVLQHLDIKKKPLDVIYNGCNLFEGEIKAPLNKPKRAFLFSLGTILPKKNFHVLPALLIDNNYELLIAGTHSPYEQKILEEAKKRGVEDRVKILGPIPEEEKQWYLKNCKAFLFPSIAEGFGLPVIEAMYYGKPVFLSRHTCLPEIGGEDAYYFNYEFEPELMRKEFREGLENFEQSGNPETIRQRALSFSWENAAKSYWDIYDSLIK